MHRLQRLALGLALITGTMGAARAEQRIRIASDWGSVTATLAGNEAGRALARMLPLRIEMNDHLRQEKVGNLPGALPEITRHRDFSAGTLGIWRSDRFVIYYATGQVPEPGIMIVGKVDGDVSLFDRPGPITATVDRID